MSENIKKILAQGKLNALEKQRKETEDAVNKLIATPMQQLLPEVFEEKRAIPNCFLRGALFGMVRKGRRGLVNNEQIFTMSNYNVTFSGEHLDQNDLELWDTLIYLAKNRKIDNELRISLYELRSIMRMSQTQTAYDALKTRVKRLQFGQVNIKNGKKEYFGSLIDDGYIDSEGDGKLIITYNKKLAPLFSDNDFTFISVDIRHLLGDNQLARWLYNFYESHKKPIPFKLEFLQKLCRSESEFKGFKRLMKQSLELVKNAHKAVNMKSKWEYEITNNNYLIIYSKGKKNSKTEQTQLELFKTF